MAKTEKFKVTTKKKVCYVIEIADSKTGEFFYKVGETAMDKEDRILALLNKYEGESRISARLLFTTPLPSKNGLYITDTTTRNYLISNNKFLQVHPDRVKGMINGTDGYTEWLMLPNGKQIDSKEFEVIVELAIDELAKVDDNFTGMLKLSYDPTQTHRVSYRMMREFDKVMVDENGKKCSIDDLVNKTGKTFLFIGQFLNDFIYSFALRNDVTIWHDNEEERVDSEYLPFNEKIYYVTDLKEIIAMGKKFDFIIANPPYSMASSITDAVRNCIDFKAYINLMPKSDYASKELYRYVTDIESVPDCFDDAYIGPVLTVATISKSPVNCFENFEELEILTSNSMFSKIYANNAKRKATFKFCALLQGFKTEKEVNKCLNNLDIKTTFLVPERVCVGGISTKENAIGVAWNKNYIDDKSNITYGTQGKGKYRIHCGTIIFNTEQERINFTNFWFGNDGNNLMNKLILGLKKMGSQISLAIPRVDWSRPWTDEEILLDYGYTPEEIRKILA